MIGALGGLVVLILLIVGAFVIGEPLVDVLLILCALVSLAAFAMLGYAAWTVIGLVKEVKGDVQTLVGVALETFTEVRGTARFISDNVVSPVSQAVSFVSAARATAKAFTEPLYSKFKG